MLNNFIDNQSAKELSVSELSNRIKELLESNFGYVRVKGEISGLKVASSGHGYFNLKENTAILACTCWRPTLAKIKFPLTDGMEVVISGKLSSYSGNSRYQLSVENIEPAGLGAMMQILNERKARLEKEGLFNKIRKRLPYLPTKIGVVTSLTGAVIKDIIHRITDRFPSRIIIWPVSVQGENAGNEIAEAIEGFNNLEEVNKPDVIIVARGGGSIEDLWAFNDEIVVRATFNSVIPIISAVGHEVDYTLIDLAADKRAPTPTAAAEFAVPVLAILNHTLQSHENILLSRINRLMKYQQQNISNYERIYKYFINYTNNKQQLLDEVGFNLLDSLPCLIKLKKTKLESFTKDRINPSKIVTYKALELTHQTDYMIKSIDNTLKNFKYKLTLNSSLLTSLDYNNVLKRGFAIIKSEDGKFLSSKNIAETKEKFSVKFFDGEVKVVRDTKCHSVS
ncbi:exodeoxyribonuclease VII large subunit [Rickettsia endosymbiont of Halotydeus destructor]|uniref:exodeoxyribonuclease VII large subunit n=1 Tax=Rickettsia endosymbiont of Halotydeus destructor TaxID=2996754 RepID=UPI003BAF7C73